MNNDLMKPRHIMASIAISIILGFFIGLTTAIYEITVNQYIQYETYRLVIYTLQEYLNKLTIHMILLQFIVLALLILPNFIWRLFFPRVKKFYIDNRALYSGSVLIILAIFFIVVGWMINRYCLPNKFRPISLSFDIALFGFTVFLAFILLDFNFDKASKKLEKLRIPHIALFLIGFAVVFNISIMAYDKITYLKKPNVILISIDTLRADHLGCYGYTKNTTPNIDNFAKDSLVFKNCISQAPSTLPSHASIFTSLICYHHNAFISRDMLLSKKIMTMAEFLKNSGYATVSFNGGGQINEFYGMGQGFDIYYSLPTDSTFGESVTCAIKWLHKNRDKNFFMFLHTLEVHHPYTPQKKYLDMFETDYKGNLQKDISITKLRNINDKKLNINSDDLKHIINCYDAEIRSMDDAFFILEEYLKKANIYDNTIIIFTSDHGEEFGEHGQIGWHGRLYDECLRVPLVIKFPGQSYKGKEISQLVRSVDILPTSLDLLGINKNISYFDGVSLFPIISNEKIDMALYAVSQKDTSEDFISLRTPYWKLIDDALYNLKDDPLEKQNVFETSKEIRFILTEKLRRLLDNKNEHQSEVKTMDLDEEAKNELRSLGYLQ